ncbi:anhydro-N-acetylmuramic acid kinase [Lyngbya sp. CCY1209]|uniref:anhydro-N-acetylmuramic acid kinase n=1 Tax=Lyngbya sp. CCY1209 TaxID=2886103 RepID=UPI002D20E43A|nr:anhydro-N-acetylmuramic acid kinase [Lyngbya sp. CCY1209]MEB3882467.1 anhydro-N-acetylmuramic acid kinase [Lyngbya sp. CCY1209]
MTRVIGLISGTSADGIDAALVEIGGGTADLRVECLRAATYPYPPELRSRILAVCGGEPLSVAELVALDDAIAREFARAALAIQDPTRPAEAIGSHGQTVYHRPPDSGAEMPLGCSVQLGRGEAIAYQTGIPTVSNFRAADLAAGGEGAPLVPAVDAHLLRHPAEYRCIQNLGGIGNVTALPPGKRGESEPVRGWDTGPGNALLDLAVEYLSGGQQTYDRDGAWAAAGTPDTELVERWLKHPFFRTPPPKSTGREVFGPDYLRECLQDAESRHLTPADLLATLTELTAASVADSYRRFVPRQPDRVLLCGGGSHNRYLRSRLERLFAPIPIQTTTEMGVDGDFKEAIAFAVLAYWRLLGIPGNLPAVTGASRSVLLGNISPPPRPA